MWVDSFSLVFGKPSPVLSFLLAVVFLVSFSCPNLVLARAEDISRSEDAGRIIHADRRQSDDASHSLGVIGYGVGLDAAVSHGSGHHGSGHHGSGHHGSGHHGSGHHGSGNNGSGHNGSGHSYIDGHGGTHTTSHHGEHAHVHPSHGDAEGSHDDSGSGDKQEKRKQRKQRKKRSRTKSQYRGSRFAAKAKTPSRSGGHGATSMGTFGHLTVALGAITANNMLQEGSVKDGALRTLDSLKTPEFLLGTLPGGLIGAHIGSMIPLAGMIGATGFLGTALGVLPAIAMASLCARLASSAIAGVRQGNLSFAEIFSSIDYLSLGVQVLGAAVGVALGGLFFPAPMLASLAGGVLGAYGMGRLLEVFRSGGSSSPGGYGHDDGHDDGYDDGHDDGHDDEHANGHANGHDSEHYNGHDNEYYHEYDHEDDLDMDEVSIEEKGFASVTIPSSPDKGDFKRLKERVKRAYRRFAHAKEGNFRVKALMEYQRLKAKLLALEKELFAQHR